MEAMERSGLRIDKLLWYLRFCKSRSQGRVLAEDGRIRVNGRPICKAHHQVRVGDVLTLFAGGRVQTVRIESLPQRRGPPGEAQMWMTLLSGGATNSTDGAVHC